MAPTGLRLAGVRIEHHPTILSSLRTFSSVRLQSNPLFISTLPLRDKGTSKAVSVTFRPAIVDDVPFITSLLSEFYHRAGSIYGIPFNEASTIQTIRQVLDRGVCLVGPSSCAGALLCKFPYNHDAIIAQVAFWYFKRPKEIAIFDALMKACKERGATHINATSLTSCPAIQRHYEAFKLTPVEIQSIREL